MNTSGYRAHASTTGAGSHASTTGDGAHASTTGYQAKSSTTGHQAHASTNGNYGIASTTGHMAHASTNGYRAHASTTGAGSHASTTGAGARASANGLRSHAVSLGGAAESRCGVAVGRWVRLTETSCAALVLPDDPDVYHPYLVSVDDGWSPGVWITMEGGWVVERPDVLLWNDGRGYQLRFEDGRYVAGCRNFSFDEAVKHWSDPNHPARRSAALLLAAVQHHGGNKLPPSIITNERTTP